MRLNLFAHTSPGINYPEYLSINREADQTTIIVRSAAKADGACGECAQITLDAPTFAALVAALKSA